MKAFLWVWAKNSKFPNVEFSLTQLFCTKNQKIRHRTFCSYLFNRYWFAVELVYRKTTRLPLHTRQDKSTGETVNLMSNDTERLFYFWHFFVVWGQNLFSFELSDHLRF